MRLTNPAVPSGTCSATRGLVVGMLAVLAFASAATADLSRETPPVDEETPALAAPSPVGELRYTPGHGLRIGDTGLTLGGYTNLNLTRDDGGPAIFSLDDLSFFVAWDPAPRVHLFSELELEDLVDVDDHGRRSASSYTTERLYGDFVLSDSASIRVGKFLTPVGRWNVIHAQPLVWTTSRPLVTEVPFDPHTTGAMLFGSLFPDGGGLTWQVFGQFTDQFDPAPTIQPADRSAGARLEWATRGGWSLGGSYLASSDPRGWRHLEGLDGLWRRDGLELMGELAVVEPRRGSRQWGLYLQAVQEVVQRVYLVGRYEHFDEATAGPAVEIGVVGLAYKPLPYVVVKAEYLFSNHRTEEEPPGVKTSLAILF